VEIYVCSCGNWYKWDWVSHCFVNDNGCAVEPELEDWLKGKIHEEFPVAAPAKQEEDISERVQALEKHVRELREDMYGLDGTPSTVERLTDLEVWASQKERRFDELDSKYAASKDRIYKLEKQVEGLQTIAFHHREDINRVDN
jgi:uncharacterized coiled-coil protein SlyX